MHALLEQAVAERPERRSCARSPHRTQPRSAHRCVSLFTPRGVKSVSPGAACPEARCPPRHALASELEAVEPHLGPAHEGTTLQHHPRLPNLRPIAAAVAAAAALAALATAAAAALLLALLLALLRIPSRQRRRSGGRVRLLGQRQRRRHRARLLVNLRRCAPRRLVVLRPRRRFASLLERPLRLGGPRPRDQRLRLSPRRRLRRRAPRRALHRQHRAAPLRLPRLDAARGRSQPPRTLGRGGSPRPPA